ncbi:MAG TPA: dihydroneopterin aldolase [Cytophagales bacterium]|nr:dihydroneopterin aldolase [Cytophagales bacterium]HAA17530.1 dihydroneopterin aldolase [Cytophagales bacterium]HAP59442.1 dihydroneopterin aldolase [Cytophagales bacterium]
MQGVIALEGLEFYAYHGVHPEEQVIGNRFVVDLEVVTDVSKAVSHDELEGTVDYGHLYKVVEEVMAEPVKLLEHLGGKIMDRILQELPAVTQVMVSVAKANPPVGGVARQSKVRLTQARNI